MWLPSSESQLHPRYSLSIYLKWMNLISLFHTQWNWEQSGYIQFPNREAQIWTRVFGSNPVLFYIILLDDSELCREYHIVNQLNVVRTSDNWTKFLSPDTDRIWAKKTGWAILTLFTFPDPECCSPGSLGQNRPGSSWPSSSQGWLWGGSPCRSCPRASWADNRLHPSRHCPNDDSCTDCHDPYFLCI